MPSIRGVLRLKYGLGRSHRQIAGALGIANSTVSLCVSRAAEADFAWPLPEGLNDTALEAALFPPQPPSRDIRPEHMPAAHRARLLWSPSRLIAWAGKSDPTQTLSSDRSSRPTGTPSRACPSAS